MFVRASRLYHVESGNQIRHPAFSATDVEVRQAIEAIERRESE